MLKNMGLVNLFYILIQQRQQLLQLLEISPRDNLCNFLGNFN